LLEQSKEYLAAVKSPQRQVDARFTLNNRVYTGRQLAKLDYDQAIVSGSSYTFGGAYVAGLTVEIKELVEGLMEMMPATAEIGIVVNGKVEYKPLGQFFITDIELDRNANSTKLKLQDGFCRLNGEYKSKLGYRAQLRDVYSEICQSCNIQTTPTNIPSDMIVRSQLNETSYREAIKYVAQMIGSYAIFNRYGQLEMRKIAKISYRVTRDNYIMGGFKRKEVMFRLNGIECELDGESKLSVGSSNGNVAKMKNPMMTQEYLENLFDRVKGFQFYPYSLNFQGDPCLEAGDWIEVEFSKGEYFQAPILVEKLSFDGGLHSEIAANTTGISDVVYQYKSPLARKVEYLEGRLSADGLTQVYSGLDEPNHAHLKKGDTWFKPNGTDIDILMWDGEKWVVHNSREKFDELEKEFEEVKKEFEENKKTIEENDRLVKESTTAIDDMREKFNQVDNTLESQQGLFEEFGNELSKNISLAEELNRKSSLFESGIKSIQSSTKDLMDAYSGIYDKTRDLENIFENLSYSGENYFSRLGLSNCSPNKGIAFDSVTNEVTLGKYGAHSFTQFYNMLKPMKDFVGKHVMLSFDAISPNGKARIRPYNDVSHGKYVMQPVLLNDNNIVDNEWKHFDYKIDVVETNDTNELESNKILFFANDQNGVKIRNVDFYIGDKPRDYRAPTLDLEILTRGKITDIEHRLVEEDNKIRNYFTGQIQSLNGDISTAKTAITQELNRYKVEMAEKNKDQDQKYSSLEQTDTAIKSSITAVDKRMDSVVSGTGNIVDANDPVNPKANVIKDGTAAILTHTIFATSDTCFYLNLTENLIPGAEYRLEFDCEGIQSNDVLVYGLGGDYNPYPMISIVNGKNDNTFIHVGKKTNELRIDDVPLKHEISTTKKIKLSNFKLTCKGISGAIIATNSNIIQTAEGIRSEINQKITAVDGRVTTLNNTLTQTAEGIRSEVTQKIGGIDGKISTLGTQVDQTANSWAVKNIKNAKEIVSQINLNGADVYIQGKNIALDGNTHITNGIIKTAHIGDAQITNAKIGNAAITSAKIQDASIVNAKIADATIAGAKIQDATITNAKIVNLDAAKITTGYLESDRIKAGSITADKIRTTSLSALSADLGDIRTGRIRSYDGNFDINATNGTIGSRSGSNNIYISSGELTMRKNGKTVEMDGDGLIVTDGTYRSRIQPQVIEVNGAVYASDYFRNANTYVPFADIVQSSGSGSSKVKELLRLGSSSNPYLHIGTDGGNYGVTAWSSDEKLKENIYRIDDDEVVEKIKKVNVYSFDWKADGTHTDYGFVAQNLQKTFPQSVFDVDGTLNINVSGIVPPMLAAIKALTNRVEWLESIINNTRLGEMNKWN
jgi:hypothetical protein